MPLTPVLSIVLSVRRTTERTTATTPYVRFACSVLRRASPSESSRMSKPLPASGGDDGGATV